MTSMTWEESIELDEERVRIMDRAMSRLGFTKFLPHDSTRVRYQFTDSILYLHEQSGDWVDVFFPYEDQVQRGLDITVQAIFNKSIRSPEWESLSQFEEAIVPWIEACRGKK